MITQEAFNGGAKYTATAGNITLYLNSARLQHVRRTSGGTTEVDLPAPDLWRVDQRGGSHFLIVNDATSSGSVRIRFTPSGGGTTNLVTLTAGQAAEVFLSSATTYVHRLLTVGTARSSAKGSHATVVDEEVPETFAPFCGGCDGDDCDYAASIGLVPLDGADGRYSVVIPMFQNPELALNQKREPIRVADIVMPSVAVIKFFLDEFDPDPLHPLAATVLSQQFYDNLYRNGCAHFLTYDAALSGTTTSRHWHHIRRKSSWVHGSGAADLPVQRHVWKEQIAYTPKGGTAKTLETRMVVEHTCNPEPSYPVSGTGGVSNPDHACWGAMISFYVFTNELSPSFVDGNSYTPAGGSAAVTFTKADPAVSGIARGVSGGTVEDKFCHPQMVICCHIPMTFHSPIGQNWVPVIERALAGLARGQNREYAYTVGNGSPWSTINESPNAISDAYGIQGNVVFGHTGVGPAPNYAAMTLGGDEERSELMEWLVFENGAGVGRTYLKPKNAGWDEARGILSLSSSGSVKFCMKDKYGVDDGSGNLVWPRPTIRGCEGHLDEPFENVGGTHRCWHNNGSTTNCCIAFGGCSVIVQEKCLQEKFKYGDPNTGLSECDELCYRCKDLGSRFTQIVLGVEDYTYNMGGDQDLRALSWVTYKQDPDMVQYSYDYTAGGDGNFVNEIGSFTLGATIVCATVSGSAIPIRGFVSYSPSGSDLRDFTLRVRAKKATLYSHGIGYRADDVGADSFTGFAAMIVPTGGTNATVTIGYYVANVLTTTIATKNITNLDNDVVELTGTIWGTEITFGWEVTGHDPDSLTGNNVNLASGGHPGLVTGSATAGAEFDNWELDDDTITYVEIAANIAKSSSGIEVPNKALVGWNQCDRTYPDGAGVYPDGCNRNKFVETQLSVAGPLLWAGPDDVSARRCNDETPLDGSNPTYCGAGNPYGCSCESEVLGEVATTCDCCYKPFELIAWCIPTPCHLPEKLNANLCQGLSYWVREVCIPGSQGDPKC